MKSAALTLALCLLIGVCLIRLTTDAESSPYRETTIPVQSGEPQLMAATYYSLQDKLRTSISLNNKGIVPLEVRPTLFNLAGERLNVPPVTINPTSFLVFDLAEWAAPGGEAFEQGSIQLFYRGKDLLLGAQIKMIDSDSSLIFDEQLTEPSSMRSSRLDGLWSIPSLNSQVRVVISNTSDLRQAAQVKLDGIEPKQEGLKELILEPHQTLIIDPALDVIDRTAVLMKAGGMTITHSGKPGALIARAMIENPSTGYSSSVQFIDPSKSRSSKLHGAGLRIESVEGEELTPVIVARNIGEKATTLRGRINYTRKDGSRGVMPIRSASLSVGEAKTWEVAEVAALRRTEIRSAGLEFEYNSQPGSVMISALSTGSRGNQVFQVPMLDPSAQTSSTGVYPFYLDYGSSTTVYIKNTTNQEQKYIAHLVYEDSRYRIGTKNIAAGETVAIDIRSLRDSQIPDEEGEVVPASIARGQLRWTRIDEGEADSPAMIGRAEQVCEGRAMSSTYACQSCCGDTPVDRFTSPPLSSVQVGQTVQMRAFEIRSDCNGWEYQVERSASWNSSNQQVATVSGSQIRFVGGGETTIKASWNSVVPFSTQCLENPIFSPGPEPIGPTVCCNNRLLSQSVSTTAQVISVKIKRDGMDITNTTQNVIVGQKISLTVEITPANTTVSSRQWTVPEQRIANYIAGLGEGKVIPLTNLGNSTIDFYWVDGGDGRQVTCIVTIGGANFTAMSTFNVKRPTSVVTTTTGPILVRNEDGDCVLRFGTPQSHGIDFVRTRQIPTGFSGATQWVQLATPVRREKRNDNTCWILTGDGLDTAYPYTTEEQAAQDNPGANLDDNSVEESVDDEFIMWLMFKPSLPDSIWVPLKKVTWGWTALARRNAAGCNTSGAPPSWTLVSSSKRTPAVVDTTEFPIWIGVANTNRFFRVPCQ